MTLRMNDIVIDCQNPRSAADFWCAALGYRVTDTDETGVAVGGHSSAPTLLFLVSTDRKLHKNRIHFDVCPVDGYNPRPESRATAITRCSTYQHRPLGA
jgi:hypothetical protein